MNRWLVVALLVSLSGCKSGNSSNLKPDDIAAALSAMDRKAWQDAIEPLGRVIDGAGRLDVAAQFLVKRAECYIELGDPDNAIADCNRALDFEEDIEAHIQRGRAYLKKSDKQMADADFRKVRASNPKFVPPKS